MKVTREEARRIADLARLSFDDAGLDRIAGDLTQILSYVDQLAEIDDDPAAADPVATPLASIREDDVRPSLDVGAVAANAPKWRDGLFVVPKVIGSGS